MLILPLDRIIFLARVNWQTWDILLFVDFFLNHSLRSLGQWVNTRLYNFSSLLVFHPVWFPPSFEQNQTSLRIFSLLLSSGWTDWGNLAPFGHPWVLFGDPWALFRGIFFRETWKECFWFFLDPNLSSASTVSPLVVKSTTSCSLKSFIQLD